MNDTIDDVKESIDRVILFESAILIVKLSLFLIDRFVFVKNK